MNKKITIMSGLFLAVSLPGMAQEAAAQEPSMFSGPNAALFVVAIVQLIAILSVASILKRITHNTKYFVKLRELRKSQSTKTILVTGLFLGAASVGKAQTATPEFPAFFNDPNTVLLLSLNILLLGVFIYLTSLLKRTIAMLMPEVEKTPETKTEKAPESTFIHTLTDAVPVEREHEVMTDHEYDGIRELDNNLPPWWVWMFNLTIVFAVVYLVYFHVLPYGMTQEEEYIAELEQAEIEKEKYLALMKDRVTENNVVFLDSEADLNAGKGIYVANCQQCHAPDGGGGVGPNFTDEYWIHGGSIKDIFSTVKYGVPSKGMISWEAQLRPLEMAQVSSYIQTLVGTEPLNPKEPQGELYTPEAAPADTSGTEAPDESETEVVDEDNKTASIMK